MSIKLTQPQPKLAELKPRITVIGVGGAGGNAVNNMIRARLEGVEFLVANTDAQSLSQSLAERRIQLGIDITQGLGAGARPDVGRGAAEEALAEVMDQVAGSHMVFIAAGMGGGTGTGAAPVIARATREQGILTVGVVTKPFHFEGQHRMRIAENAIEELSQYVDTLIIIPNQNLFRIANESTTFAQAFKLADDVLYSGVRGVTDLMVMPGLVDIHSHPTSEPGNKGLLEELGSPRLGMSSLYEFMPIFRLPPPLIPRHRRLELDERMDAEGRVVQPVTRDAVAAALAQVEDPGAASFAVSLLHAYRNGESEAQDVVREPFSQIARFARQRIE
mgnify:CR=1 FL=1